MGKTQPKIFSFNTFSILGDLVIFITIFNFFFFVIILDNVSFLGKKKLKINKKKKIKKKIKKYLEGNVNALGFISGDVKSYLHYHKTTDTFDKVSETVGENVIKFAAVSFLSCLHFDVKMEKSENQKKNIVSIHNCNTENN